MPKNPFKFGSVVDTPYFTDRREEMRRVKEILASENHLIISSPRRFGKSSLIFKAVQDLDRPVISLDLQLITSTADLASQLLRRIYRIYPFEKVRQYVLHFRVIPTLKINPVSNAVDVSFHQAISEQPLLEDVLNLLEQLSSDKKRLIVIFDEFQEAARISPQLLQQMRAIMQHHKKLNYIFMGSQESLIREIFEKKKSSFYHFGLVMPLGKIPKEDFESYLIHGFQQITNESLRLAEQILHFSDCHPYYTQQLAYMVWEKCRRNPDGTELVAEAVQYLIRQHDMDYERIWYNCQKTDKKLLIGMALSGLTPLSQEFFNQYDIPAASTAYSSLKRLAVSGMLSKTGNRYEIDDPFFSLWLKQKREE
jgi:hypothetical protein